MQSLSNLNFDTYGYSFSDMMGNNGGNMQQQQQQQLNGGNMLPMMGGNTLPMQGNNGGMTMQLVNDQGLSPPYSNHSPPHSVQSSAALSPPGCIGKELRRMGGGVKDLKTNILFFQHTQDRRPQPSADLDCLRHPRTLWPCDRRHTRSTASRRW